MHWCEAQFLIPMRRLSAGDEGPLDVAYEWACLVVGFGAGSGDRLPRGTAIAPTGTPAAFDFDAFPGFTGGVFVG